MNEQKDGEARADADGPMADDQPQHTTSGLPIVYVDVCKSCNTTAPPDAMGLCSNPKCRAVRKGSKLAQRYGPPNTRKQKELRERFAREYQPVSAIDEVRCLDLADTVERLSVVKKGTTEHGRLVQTRDATAAALEESRRARATRPTDDALHDETLPQLQARLERLASALRETAALSELVERRQEEDRARSKTLANPAVTPIHDDSVQFPVANATSDAGKAELCKWCNSTPCIGIEHEAYWTLHPEAAQKRDEALRLEQQACEEDAREYLATGRITPHMRARQAARERPPTDEEKRAAEVRKALGHDRGVMNEQSGYRFRE